MPALEVDGVPIGYAEAGAGMPVVLLHSSASSGRQWQALMERLARRYRVLAVDLHGYGESGSWHDRRPFTLADEAAVVMALARKVGTPVHIVGHSYGGAVALLAALWLRGQTASLTVIEPAAFSLLRGGDFVSRELFDEIRAVADTLAAALARGEAPRAMAGFVNYWNGLGSWQALSETAQARLAPLARKVAAEFTALFAETMRGETCRALTAPTLVLRGTHSPMPARHVAGIVAASAPGAELQAIAGAGHMLPLTHADAVNRAVEKHLAAATAPLAPMAQVRAAERMPFPRRRSANSTPGHTPALTRAN